MLICGPWRKAGGRVGPTAVPSVSVWDVTSGQLWGALTQHDADPAEIFIMERSDNYLDLPDVLTGIQWISRVAIIIRHYGASR